MKFVKLQLLIIALVVFVAGSAFASVSYDVSINTSSLTSPTGYLYLQYQNEGGATSTATISNFSTDGALGAQDLVDVVNGSAVTGTLPNSVVFANTNGINDYQQAITFGSTINFVLSLSNPGPLGTLPVSGSSTFLLGLFADQYGSTPLVNTNGGTYAGTAFTVSLVNDGSTTVNLMAGEANVTPTPVPAALWLLGSGLAGLGVIRRKK